MEPIDALDKRVRKIGFFDLQFIKIANWFFALLIAKLIPEIMNADAGLFAVLLLLFSIRPFYVAWIKK